MASCSVSCSPEEPETLETSEALPEASTNDVDIFQFKIVLRTIKPRIWRRIQVPSNYTFREFHVAIQKAMGWQSVFADYHSHEFAVVNPESKTRHSIYSEDTSIDSSCFGRKQAFRRLISDSKSVDEYKAHIDKYFKEPAVDRALYTYDFGDNWLHLIRFEQILKPEPGVQYPRCVDGERACPPEDCGGPRGYHELLQILDDKKHPTREEKLHWLTTCNPGFKPDAFDANIPFVRPYDVVLEFLISIQDTGAKMTWYDLQVPDYFTMHKLHVSLKKILALKSTKNSYFTTCDVNYADLRIDAKTKENSPKIYEFFGYIPQSAYFTLDEKRSHKIIMVASYVPEAGKKYPNCEGGARWGPFEDCDGEGEPETFMERFQKLQRIVKFPKGSLADLKADGVMFLSDCFKLR